MRVAVLVVLLMGLSVRAQASDVFEEIDRAYASGRITAGERLIQRVAAVRSPKGRVEKGCHSEVLMDAFQHLPTLPNDERGALQALLDPPSDLAYSVESSTPFPVRVSFATPAEQTKAERILQAIATAYQKQVVEWGFWTPIVEPGTEPYRFYIMNAGGAAGYTSPYAENDATPHADAFTYIVIDPSLEDLQLDATVTHEFNHACQTTMDVMELPSFMENTASYIEIPVLPASMPLAAAMFPYFQSRPYRALEFRAAGQTDGYEYGGALWPLFLTHYYAAGDPVWIRQVWEGSVQTGFVNEPDYFDVIDQKIEGGVAEAAKRFAEERFFVGAYDDGQHLPFAGQWGGAEVWTSGKWFADQLPVIDARPTDANTRPQPNGCNYVLFTPDAAGEYPVRFSFEGDATARWNVSILELSQESNAREMPIDAQGAGALSVDANLLDEVALVICQGMPDGYDPDDSSWLGADYRYGIDYERPAPTIASITPGELAAGTHDQKLTIEGTGFLDHPDLSVAVSGGRIAVELLEATPDRLIVNATVAPTAELGVRDLTVTNPGGATATAQLAIVAPTVAEPVDAGGGCHMQPDARPRWSALFGLLGALLLLRRRRLLLALALIAFPSVAWAGPPPPSVGFVESSRYPLRVYYAEGVEVETATTALGFAEESWQVQTEQMGFRPSVTEDDTGARIPGLRIYLDPDAAYNHASAISDNPDTPQTDCTVRVIVASLGNTEYLRTVVAHEMNHAFEMTADCGESDFAWENTTVAVTALLYPEDALFNTYLLPTFQQFPHHGFDCGFWFDEEKRYYHYGAALWQIFLEDRYGNYDGKLLASMWEAAMQDGTVVSVDQVGQLDVPNDPDLFEAMHVVLGETSFEEAFSEFGRWRYFVGARDDGQHFTHGSTWKGSEVRIDTALGLEQLPVQGVPLNGLNDYGTTYIELSLLGIDDQTGVTFDFSGDPGVAWSVDALLVKTDQSADVKPMTVTDARGSLLLDGLTDYTTAVFVISNLSNGMHDPDTANCNIGASFTYDLKRADLAKPPTITALDPSQLTIGTDHYLWVSGSDFTEASAIDFGAGITVTDVSYVDESTLGVAVRVGADADPGPRDVTVTSGDLSGTLPGGVTIVAEEKSAGGCGCSTAGRRNERAVALVFLLALLLVRRARRIEDCDRPPGWKSSSRAS